MTTKYSDVSHLLLTYREINELSYQDLQAIGKELRAITNRKYSLTEKRHLLVEEVNDAIFALQDMIEENQVTEKVTNSTPTVTVEPIDCDGNLRRRLVEIFTQSSLNIQYHMSVDHETGWIAIRWKGSHNTAIASFEVADIERWMRARVPASYFGHTENVTNSDVKPVSTLKRDYPITTSTSGTLPVKRMRIEIRDCLLKQMDRFFSDPLLFGGMVTLHFSEAR